MRRVVVFLVPAALAALLTAVPDAGAEGEGAVPVVVDSSIAVGGDDAEELATGYPLLTSTDLELVDAEEGPGQVVGLRFTGLDLPRHAVITEAWVQFTVEEAQSDPTNLTIAGHLAGSAPPFAAVLDDVSHRPRTTATVPWSPDPWTDVGSAGPASRTPDLTPVVQELVHEPGWDPTSALALVLSGTGHRTAAAEEHATLDPPSLHVAYLPPTADVGVDARVGLAADDAEEAPTGIVTRSSGDLELVHDADAGVLQTVGVRFADLDLPRGAVIQRAWIQFTADEVQSEATDLTIAAHAVDNAPKLGPNAFNLTSQNPTSATVGWSPPPWTAVGEATTTQRTPDLRVLVQDVVDRPFWVGTGGALAFTFRGTGHRTAVAFDQSPAQAPALHIDYLPGPPAPFDPAVHRFAVIGDFGDGGTNEGRVANLVHRLDVEDVLTVGDNSYGANPIDENIGRQYMPYIGNHHGAYGTGATTNRFWPSLGNHDYTDGGGLAAYLDYFDLPGNERYYDVVLGPLHVFALNSNAQEPDGRTANSVQAQWLRDGLAASTAPWQVVLLHHSPFSSGLEHGSDPILQWPFAEWGVDLVLSGHDHDYERHEVDGTPYVVTGLGGASRYGQGPLDPHSVFFTNADDGAVLLEACAGRLDLSFETVSSGVLDTRSLGGPSCAVPTVTASATTATAAEAGADGEVTVVRSGETNRPLAVHYSVGGTAAAADIDPLSGTVTIPAGTDRATVAVHAVDDTAVEDDESMVLTLTDAADLDVGPEGTATVTVRSDDVEWVSRDLYPVSHQQVFGTVTAGGVLALRTSDNQRMALREELGSGANPNSLLEFRFPLNPLPTFRSLTLVVEAHHSVNTEGDDLLVDWSRNGGPWHPLVTVTKTADNGTAQFKLLPSWVNAGDVVSLRVRDANRTPGRRQLDTAYLDRLFLRAVVPA